MHYEAMRISAFFTKQGNKMVLAEVFTYLTETITLGLVCDRD